MLIIPKNIVTADRERRILNDHAVEIIDGKISAILPLANINLETYGGEVVRHPRLTMIPGFVQTHIHLCQTLFRGLADDLELLDWLQKRIFPFENAHSKHSLRISARLGINELLTCGTTSFADMGTLRHQEVIFEELISSGVRAFAGKCMIDQNELFPEFRESTDHELKYSFELAKEYHNACGGRIKYAFAPRFVLSCSEKLLKETKSMGAEFGGSLFHTHASENKAELETVRKMHGMDNIDYFDNIGVLDESTILAHCIHVNENEISVMKNKNVKVSHCPSSNLKLGSGFADIPRYLREGISVSIGADGAPCNNNLNIFTEMRTAALIQKPFHGPTAMDAETVFRMATIGGAEALNIAHETGSIETGKKADLVLLDLETSSSPMNGSNVYSSIVYSSYRENVKYVMAEGEWLVEKGVSKVYDENELVAEGASELENLLNRINS